MTEADFFAVVERQRAHRAFSDAPLTDADVAAVLRAATFAPSAENKQPWEFVVVREEAKRAAIAGIMQRAWETVGRAHSAPRLSPAVLREVDTAMTGGFARAPVHVVVGADVERGLEATVGSSIFPAVQNLLLAATARGLASALTTIATTAGKELATIVELPRHVRAVAVVPLGHPAKPLGPPRRDPFEVHTHRDAYGTPW